MSSDLEPDESPEAIAADLRDMVAGRGWQRLTRHAANAWGMVGYGIKMRAAVRQVGQGPERVYELARVAEQVDATKEAIDEILNWPFQEINRLKPEPKSKRPFAALRRS